MADMILTTMDVYELCNKYQWFTCGTCEQYDRMFEFVRERNIKSLMIDYDMKELACIIWICSDEKFTVDEIYKAIRQKFADKYGLYI